MTIEDIVRMAQEARVSLRGHYDETGSTPQELERFTALVAAAEREACAVVCEDIDEYYEGEDVLATWCADAIRARSRK